MQLILDTDADTAELRNAKGLGVAHATLGQFLAGYDARLGAQRGLDVGLLPPAVRWLGPDGLALIFERPPMRTRIRFTPASAYHAARARAAGGQREFNVPVPWQLYALRFGVDARGFYLHSLRVYARNRPLTPGDTALYQLPLPNLYPSGEACLGDGFAKAFRAEADRLTGGVTLAKLTNLAVGMFWGGDANLDLTWTEAYRLPAQISDEIKNLGDSDGDADTKSYALLEAYEAADLRAFTQWDFAPSNQYNTHDTFEDLAGYLVTEGLEEQPTGWTGLLSCFPGF